MRAQLVEAMDTVVDGLQPPANLAALKSAETVVSTKVRETRPRTQLESRTVTSVPAKRSYVNSFAPAPPKSNKIPFAIAAAILLLLGGAAAFWIGIGKDAVAPASTTQAALQQSASTTTQQQQTTPPVSAVPDYNSSGNAPVNYTTQPAQQPAANAPSSETVAAPLAANTPNQAGVQSSVPAAVVAAVSNNPIVSSTPEAAPTVDAQKLEMERREQERREQARRLEDETRGAIEQMQRQMNPDYAPGDVRSSPEQMRNHIDRIYQENLYRIRDINRRRVNSGLSAIAEPPAPRHPPMPPGPRPRF
jgi:hypothetical protein